MSEIKLRSTFQILNDLGGEVSEIERDLLIWNSVHAELSESREQDPRALLERREHLISRLVEVKTVRAQANAWGANTGAPSHLSTDGKRTPLLMVNMVQEMKAFAAFLQTMLGGNCKHGKEPRSSRHVFDDDDGGPKFVEWHAVFKTVDIREKIKAVRGQIRSLQDELDVFNNTATVELSFDLDAM